MDIAAFRLANQRLTGTKVKTPSDVVSLLGAVQGYYILFIDEYNPATILL